MRILVCGGRDFTDWDVLSDILDEYAEEISVLIQGGAQGADRLAKRWAKSKGIPVIEMEANWDYYDNAAGPIRNGWMLKHASPDLVVAFSGAVGTSNMIKQAKRAGVEVRELALVSETIKWERGD